MKKKRIFLPFFFYKFPRSRLLEPIVLVGFPATQQHQASRFFGGSIDRLPYYTCLDKEKEKVQERRNEK